MPTNQYYKTNRPFYENERSLSDKGACVLWQCMPVQFFSFHELRSYRYTNIYIKKIHVGSQNLSELRNRQYFNASILATTTTVLRLCWIATISWWVSFGQLQQIEIPETPPHAFPNLQSLEFLYTYIGVKLHCAWLWKLRRVFWLQKYKVRFQKSVYRSRK